MQPPAEYETTAFEAAQYASIYPAGIERWYWHRARNRIITRKIRSRLSTSDPLLDLGCGAGVLVAHLRGAGFLCEGVDLGRPAAIVPGARGHLHLGQDAFLMSAVYRDRFSAILLMDVLEHLAEPSEFLWQCAEGFRNARYLFVTVPARMEIWSNFDEYNGHHRRYSLESFRALPPPPEFALEDAGYFFHALYWAARVHDKVIKTRATAMRPPTPRGATVHDLLGRLFAWEERCLSRGSRGASLYAVYSRVLPDRVMSEPSAETAGSIFSRRSHSSSTSNAHNGFE